MANSVKPQDLIADSTAETSSAAKLLTNVNSRKYGIFSSQFPVTHNVADYENSQFGYESTIQLPEKELTASRTNIFNPKPSLTVRSTKRKDKDQAPIYTSTNTKVFGY